MLKTVAKSLLILTALTSAGAGVAVAQTADDTKWVNQCVADNKDQGQEAPVIVAYCTCMNSKMSDNETRSITQWEKANPKTAEACSTQAGWKGK